MEATLLAVPLYTLAAYSGMAKAPFALRRRGLASAFGHPKDLGDIAFPPLEEDLAEGSAKNLKHFIDCTARIFERTRDLDSEFLVLVGGECSMTPGALAGLGESLEGKAGMLWLDAHGDFNTPETSPSGYIGGMCLAMACGRARTWERRWKKGGPSWQKRGSSTSGPARSTRQRCSRSTPHPRSSSPPSRSGSRGLRK